MMGLKVLSLRGASMELVQFGLGALVRLMMIPPQALQGGKPGLRTLKPKQLFGIAFRRRERAGGWAQLRPLLGVPSAK